MCSTACCGCRVRALSGANYPSSIRRIRLAIGDFNNGSAAANWKWHYGHSTPSARAGQTGSARGLRRCHVRECEKGGLAVGPTRRGKGRKSSQSPLGTVFLSPYLSKVLRRTNANWSKKSFPDVSSTNCLKNSLATNLTIRIG